MVFSSKKEDKLDVLTEDKIQQKLYGYLTEDKRPKTKVAQQSTEIPPQHILQPEKQKDVSSKLDKGAFSQDEAGLPAPRQLARQAVSEDLPKVEQALRQGRATPRCPSGPSEKMLSLMTSGVGIGSIFSFIKKIEESLPFGKQNCFRQIKKLKIPMLLILVLIFGLFVLTMRKRSVSSSVSDLNISTQTSLPAKKVEEIVSEKGPVYTIQVCVYQKAKDANRLIEELKQKNLDAYLYTDASKSRAKYLVYVGRFRSAESAKGALGKLKTMFKDSFVRRVD